MIKAALQGALSATPNPARWNRILQRYVSRSLDLSDAYFLTKWRLGKRHLDTFRRVSGADGAIDVLELGTGWFPVVPVALALGGARYVYTIDRQSLLRREQVLAVLEACRRQLERGVVTLDSPAAERKLADLLANRDALSCSELLTELGIRALVGDAREVPLPSASVDLFVSNTTLEHIPGEVIAGILTEFRRLASARAVMSHLIDMGDHYAQFDRSITVYNFLKYSDRQWRPFNNTLQYQNRLRLSDHRALHRNAGWEVVEEDNSSLPVEVLRRVKLAERFRVYDEDELRVYVSWMTSRPA